ncbi:hypothetical protein [Bacillus cereus group sp. MYBK57-1]|uniref:hypothetical protein n=1 Tax=Bacillus cereus group sp. MYBK57-1 TaxID=3450619 RepID=UPI003F7A9A98
MTAEICIMNKLGVALAADSAVSLGGTNKVYNSANKLFSLSKVQPVGIMIYGSSNYMGIPWETLIKLYRKELGNTSFDRILDYGEDFIKFLTKQDIHITALDIDNHLEQNLDNFFDALIEDLKDVLIDATPLDETLEPEQINILSKQYIAEEFENMTNKKFIPNFTTEDISEILTSKSALFEVIIEETFGDTILNDEVAVEQLKELGACYLLKEFGDSRSGVVITGFGVKEIYPSICTYTIDGIYNNKIKYELKKHRSIGEHHLGAIFPFAQTNMVHTFITGMDPYLWDYTKEQNYQQMLDLFSIVNEIISEDDEIDSDKKEEIISKIFNKAESSIQSFTKQLMEFREAEFIDPLLSIVRSLPKEELAEMAETLVNLSSFKRKVSSSIESIGGPIDVMLITKGDGLVWIKRKHYFNTEFNQDFFFNKYHINKTIKDY